MSTFGPSYDEWVDGARVRRQMEQIRDFMLLGGWCTLAEISQELGAPEASASAQLRHLRKTRFGGYIVKKRRRTSGTWEYRVLPAPPPGQIGLFERNAWATDQRSNGPTPPGIR